MPRLFQRGVLTILPDPAPEVWFNVVDSQLAEAWFELCHRCNVSLADATSMGTLLTEAYNEPQRVYHTLEHIEHCLGLAGGVPMSATERVDVQFALWFHDVVYDPRSADNEERSATMVQDWLAEMGILNAVKVAELIRMTAGHVVDAEADLATKVVHDVDLAILGAAPAVYAQYVVDIRAEYSWLSDQDFAAGRARVLEAFIGQPDVYVLEGFSEMFDEQARSNVAQELAELSAG